MSYNVLNEIAEILVAAVIRNISKKNENSAKKTIDIARERRETGDVKRKISKKRLNDVTEKVLKLEK